jgi:hypothetical protein
VYNGESLIGPGTGGTMEVTGGTITGNTAQSGGGIFVDNTAARMDITGGSITNNTATGTTVGTTQATHTDGGGGIFIQGVQTSTAARVRVIGPNVTFHGNSAATGWVANVGERGEEPWPDISWSGNHSVTRVSTPPIQHAPYDEDNNIHLAHLLNNYDVNYRPPPMEIPNLHFGAWRLGEWLQLSLEDIGLGHWTNPARVNHMQHHQPLDPGVPEGDWPADSVHLPSQFQDIHQPLGAENFTLRMQSSPPAAQANLPAHERDPLYRILRHAPSIAAGQPGNLSTQGGVTIPMPDGRRITWEEIDIVVARNTGDHLFRVPATATITWTVQYDVPIS